MTPPVEEASLVAGFPPNFVWGTATASYQIEGAVSEGGRGPSIWDTFSATPGAVVNGDTGAVACDHFHRYPEDVQLLKTLGCDAYRFSFAWPRFQPSGRGTLNAQGVAFYDRLIDALLQAEIQPWVTLYHWDLPQALEDSGGWVERDTAARFADYAAMVHGVFADRVQHWTTLNEPWCSAFLGYAAGVHAPGRRNPGDALAAAHHLLLGHGEAVTRMRSAHPTGQYGITLNLHPVYPAAPDDVSDQDAARRVDGVTNRIFLDPLFRGEYPADVISDLAGISDVDFVHDGDLATIQQPLDFFGLNYYFHQAVTTKPEPESVGATLEWVGSEDVRLVTTGRAQTDMGWEIEPEGLGVMLHRLWREYSMPDIYITENGMANADRPAPDGSVADQPRIDYLRQHFEVARDCINSGVPLRGYFVWSLLDNFEWSLGYSKRFGLVFVDYETGERTLKDSARWFAAQTRLR